MDAPEVTQRFYRAAGLRILADFERDTVDQPTTAEEQREAVLCLAEALIDLAETVVEEAPAGGRR